MLRAARFVHSYLRNPAASPREEEVRIPLGRGQVPATLFLPAGSGRGPAWVVLHGITVSGRYHPSLTRFSRALSASGAAVIVPEIPAWQQLEIDPASAVEAVSGAARFLARHPRVAPERIGAMGFSFGATQALVAGADPALQELIRGVIGFGGYFDLGRTVRFMFTGEHEWEGRRYHRAPDPYGRWVIAANYLTEVPEHAGAIAVADSLTVLAREAGRRAGRGSPEDYAAVKVALRERLAPEERELWDLLVPSESETSVDPARAEPLARALEEAALRRHPQLDPRPFLPTLDGRVALVHGEADSLIPFSETLRLASHLPGHLQASATVTALFAHSAGAEPPGLLARMREGAKFVAALQRALSIV